jgi:hypothetical protein
MTMSPANAETELANAIREKLQEVRARLNSNPCGDPLIWVILGRLACAQRPLRDHPDFGGRGKPLVPEAGSDVVAWVQRICTLGIKSVICLMHPKELYYYDNLDGIPSGLLNLYRQNGLEVCHIPWADPEHAATLQERNDIKELLRQKKRDAYDAFTKLQKPILLQCSAGIDRTAPVAAYIVLRDNRKIIAETNPSPLR